MTYQAFDRSLISRHVLESVFGLSEQVFDIQLRLVWLLSDKNDIHGKPVLLH